MTIPSIVDNLDSVPEEAKSFYKKNSEGKFELDSVSLFNSFTKVEKALGNERKIRTDFEGKFNQANKKLEGVDLEKYKKLQEQAEKWNEEKEEKDRQSLEEKGKYEEALQNLKDSHAKSISELKTGYDKQIGELKGQLETTEKSKKDYILNDKIRSSILSSGVFAEDVEDVLTLTKSKFELDEKFNVIVKDENGTPSTENIDTYFNETFKKSKPKFYQGTGSSGSGTPAGGSNTKFENKEELSSVDKISAGLTKSKK